MSQKKKEKRKETKRARETALSVDAGDVGVGAVRLNKGVAQWAREGSLVTATAERKGKKERGRQAMRMNWELKGWRLVERAALVSARDYESWNTWDTWNWVADRCACCGGSGVGTVASFTGTGSEC